MLLKNIDLKGRSIDEVFLPNRPEVDPENYRVGKVDDKIVVYNPDTQEFMEYFYDDRSDLEWFDLGFLNNKWKDYKINRYGKCLSKGGGILLKPSLNDLGYPKYAFYKGSCCTIHLLLAKYFIPNFEPDQTSFVDHINRCRTDYSLINLRWVSRQDNNANSVIPKFYSRQLYRSYSDKERTILIKEYSDEEIFNSTFSKYRIKSSIRNNKSYESFYWEIENVDISDYLKKLGVDSIDDDLWILHYSGSIYVHPLGLIKAVRKGQLSIGYNRGGYRHYQTKFDGKYKSKCVHRLIAEVFLNGNSPIEEGLVVDHINTDTLDNRVENLRIVSPSENMKNVNTILKTSTQVIDSSGKIYNSITECANENKIPLTTLRSWIKSRPEKGYKVYKP